MSINTDEVKRLSEAQKRALLSIHPGFEAGQRFRLDEGDHHAPYSALVRAGILQKERIGGHYTTYWLTEEGIEARTYLQEHSNG